jgi:hypothetical protein
MVILSMGKRYTTSVCFAPLIFYLPELQEYDSQIDQRDSLRVEWFWGSQDKKMAIERRTTPKRTHFTGEAPGPERRQDLVDGGIVNRTGFHPEASAEKELLDLGYPKAPTLVARGGTDQAESPGSDMTGQLFEECGLPRSGQIVKNIKEHDVAAKVTGGKDIADGKCNVAVSAPGDLLCLGDFRRVEIDADERRKETTFPQIELKETNTTADIEHRERRVLEQLEGSGENWITAQFSARVAL